jgi:hypothetical protein
VHRGPRPGRPNIASRPLVPPAAIATASPDARIDLTLGPCLAACSPYSSKFNQPRVPNTTPRASSANNSASVAPMRVLRATRAIPRASITVGGINAVRVQPTELPRELQTPGLISDEPCSWWQTICPTAPAATPPTSVAAEQARVSPMAHPRLVASLADTYRPRVAPCATACEYAHHDGETPSGAV